MISGFLRSIQKLSRLRPKVEITSSYCRAFFERPKNVYFVLVKTVSKIASLTLIFHKQLIITSAQPSKNARVFDYKKVTHKKNPGFFSSSQKKKSATLYFYESWEIRHLIICFHLIKISSCLDGYLLKRKAKSSCFILFLDLNQIPSGK